MSVPASVPRASGDAVAHPSDGDTSALRIAIVTLGCGRNEVDSDQLAGLFHRDGATIVEDADQADVVLVNTCTFIAPAKQESIDTVLAACDLKDEGGARAVLVVGCMAQRYPDELAEAIPEADAIVGFDGYARLPAIVGDVLGGRVTERVIGVGAAHPGSRPGAADAASAGAGASGLAGRGLPLMLAPSAPAAPPAAGSAHPGGLAAARGDGGDRDRVLDLEVLERPRDDIEVASAQDLLDRVPASGPRFPVRHLGAGGPVAPWSYLKIASGCDRVCTFCAIPSFRGRFRSRPMDEILAEARWLVDQGVRELVLVSENTTSWGKDLPGGRALQPELLRALAEIDDLVRIRLMYLQPAELTGGLLEAIATQPKVASYYDLSLQHVSGPVVARMARSGDHERFGQLIERCREADPDAVFRSNFIVGFPGETDEDVQRLEDFLLEHRLDWVGFFPFSREDGTPSDTFDDQVDEELAMARLRRLSEVQERVADEAARALVGRQLEVLVDRHDPDDTRPAALGRSSREAPDTDGEIALVTPDGTPADLPVGRLVTARVVDTVGVDLVAEVTARTAGDPPDLGRRARG
ncbi:MAG: MiaB/RimO family radical SAM methylthiotransferase [Nitriliruptoraceae bacterium]|nr:MiaB/RimO family radical SAM methylthiotransferase [Nitriliruptoraceae bacterium]